MTVGWVLAALLITMLAFLYVGMFFDFSGKKVGLLLVSFIFVVTFGVSLWFFGYMFEQDERQLEKVCEVEEIAGATDWIVCGDRHSYG